MVPSFELAVVKTTNGVAVRGQAYLSDLGRMADRGTRGPVIAAREATVVPPKYRMHRPSPCVRLSV